MGSVLTTTSSSPGGRERSTENSTGVKKSTTSSSPRSSNDSCSLKADAVKAQEMFGLKDTPPKLPPAIATILRSPCGISTALTSSIDSTMPSRVTTTASGGNVSTTAPNTTSTSDSPFSWSTMSNPYHALTESFGLPKSPLVVAPTQTLMTSFSAYMSEFISQHFIAVAFGATVGAAVATGIAIGLLASASLIHASANYVVLPAISQWTALAARIRRRRLGVNQHATLQSLVALSPSSKYDGSEQVRSPGEIQQLNGGGRGNDVSVVHLSGLNGVWIIKGSVRPILPTTVPSNFEQCRQCLQHIDASLQQQQMSFDRVLRWTVYLVTDQCSKNDFLRAMQSEYPHIDLERTMISYFYVQRLENEHAVVQVEVMASPLPPTSNDLYISNDSR